MKRLNQVDVARRWGLSPRTLERWRCTSEGPPFLKIGGRCVYRLEDIEEFEERRVRTSTRPKDGESPR